MTVKVGCDYEAVISNKKTTVRIIHAINVKCVDGRIRNYGWWATNLSTGRKVRIANHFCIKPKRGVTK